MTDFQCEHPEKNIDIPSNTVHLKNDYDWFTMLVCLFDGV